MTDDTLLHSVARPAQGEPDGLLVLHHGRGSNELDLLSLADVLDPEGRLHVVAPRAPLELAGFPGFHWYVVPRVGYPDTDTFRDAYGQLTAFHDALWEQTGIPPERTVLGGFSMGAVMSHSTAWGPGRPTVAGVLAWSGFIPVVDGWAPAFGEHRATRALVSHGAADPVIGADFGRAAHEAIAGAGLEVEYLEAPGGGHSIAPAHVARAATWLGEVVPAGVSP